MLSPAVVGGLRAAVNGEAGPNVGPAITMANSMSQGWARARRHPRVPLAIPVNISSGRLKAVGQTANASLGGLLVESPGRFKPNTEVELLFKIPTGHSINTRCTVVHVQPSSRMGLRFVELADEYRRALVEFIYTLSKLILCAGTDREVVETLKRILEQAGHTVMPTLNFNEVVAACQFDFDLAIIGPALPSQEKLRVANTILDKCPGIKILELHVLPTPDLRSSNDHLFVPAGDPKGLAEKVASMFN
jgi:hypothetical protein